jgi:excisionase family DNA binding protein
MPDYVPQLLSLPDLAERLRVSPHTVRCWVKKGRLRPIRLCRRLLFHPDEIQRFLAVNSADHVQATKLGPAMESEQIA